ncbi:MAG: hypothetical protein E7520_06800 [Ruminococcaceae bacterium]|nr:hypothetical protein [Oscillospiraceae bacterium]
MMKTVGISLSVLFCAVLLREKNRTFAVVLSILGSVLLMTGAVVELGGIVSRVRELSGASPVSLSYIKLMLKALGITLMTQFVADICRDNGENALAGVTETVAKIAVITMLLPLFETIIGIVGGLVK